MAITFTWIVSASVIALIIMQAIFVFKYFHFMNPKSTTPADAPDNDYAPKVGIVLCLRGDDPSLKACLNSLFEQTYSNYEVHFVLDDRRDPALISLQEFHSSSKSTVRTTTHFLSHEIAKTCSLKNQALITAVSNADESVEVFALVDADGVIEPDWLADLVGPLSNPKVGVTTGGRWFSPTTRNLGSLVRQTWNAAALPQMGTYNIPWGGALAIKRSTIVDCELLDHWSKAFCEDTMLTKMLGKQNLAVVRVPKVIVENKESTSLASAVNWISRQLLTVRLHHSSWPLVLAHALFAPLCFAAFIVAVALCAMSQLQFELVQLGLVAFAFAISNIALLQVIQLANRIQFGKTGTQSSDRFAHFRGPGMIAMLVTQFVYPYAAIKTALMRKVVWRGIEYKIGSGKTVAMKEYLPYRECIEGPVNAASTQRESIG